jgi:hypothetical protein
MPTSARVNPEAFYSLAASALIAGFPRRPLLQFFAHKPNARSHHAFKQSWFDERVLASDTSNRLMKKRWGEMADWIAQCPLAVQSSTKGPTVRVLYVRKLCSAWERHGLSVVLLRPTRWKVNEPHERQKVPGLLRIS